MRVLYEKDTRTGHPVRGTADRAPAVLLRTATTTATNQTTRVRRRTFGRPIGQFSGATGAVPRPDSQPGARRIHVPSSNRGSGAVAPAALLTQRQSAGGRGCERTVGC